jgi:hypothetical protein
MTVQNNIYMVVTSIWMVYLNRILTRNLEMGSNKNSTIEDDDYSHIIEDPEDMDD